MDEPGDSRPKRPAKRGGALNAVMGFLARSLQQISTLVLTLLAGAIFLPGDYAIYTLATVSLALIQIIGTTGFFHFIVTDSGEERDVASTCFWLMALLSVVAATILTLASPAIAAAFDAPRLTLMITVLAWTQPFAVLTNWGTALLMRRENLRAHFAVMIAQSGLGLLVGIVLILTTRSVYALAAFTVTRVCVGVILYPLALRCLPSLTFSRRTAAAAIRYSWGLYGTSLMTFASNYAADILLGLAFSTTEAGLYRFGNRLSTVAIEIIGQPMRSFALTRISARNRATEALSPSIAGFLSAQTILTGVVTTLLLIFLADFIDLAFEPAYAASYGIAVALAVKGFVAGPHNLVQPILAAKAQNRASMVHYTIWTALQIAGIAAMTSAGMVIMSWTQAAIALASSIAGLWLISRTTDMELKTSLRSIAKPTVFILGFAAICFAVRYAMIQQIDTEEIAFSISLGLCLCLTIAALAMATKWRLMDLSLFGGR